MYSRFNNGPPFAPVFLIIFFFLLTGCQTNQEKIRGHLKNGDKYFTSEQYKQAAIEFQNVLQLAPENHEALSRLGETMLTKLMESMR